MEQAIAFATGASIVAVSLSALIQTDAWLEWCRRFQEGGRSRAVMLGAVSFMLAAFIVALHPVWTGLAAIVTVLGVVGMLEGTLYLLCPDALSRVWAPFLKSRGLFRLSAVAGLIIGLLILYSWVA